MRSPTSPRSPTPAIDASQDTSDDTGERTRSDAPRCTTIRRAGSHEARDPLARPAVVQHPATQAAAIDRGHQCKVLNTLRFAIDLSGAEPGPPVPRQAAVRLRRDPPADRQLDHLLRYGRRAPVRADGRLHAEHRERHRQLPRQAAAPSRSCRATTSACRATTFVRNRADVLPAIERVGGAPVVIKLLEGTQGIGVILAPDNKVAEAIIETLQSTRQNVLIQQFVAESKGRDIRALVVGDRVVAAMRRTAQGDEFRTNVHRGGTVEGVTLDAGVRADRGAVGADHGPARRRRRHARGQRRPARDGGQLVARARGHRDARPISTSPARSSTTSPTRSPSPRSTSASGSR